MKYILITITALLLSSSVQASEEMETEFIERFKLFIQTENLSQENLKKVWLYEDTPTQEFVRSSAKLEATISRGIGSIQIIDIYPALKNGMAEPFEMEGDTYRINLTPYKMLEIEYVKKIEGGSAGWSYVIGESDGKLYLVGMKKQNQS